MVFKMAQNNGKFYKHEDNNIIYCADQISLSISFTAIRVRVRAIRVRVNPNSPNSPNHNSRKRNRRTYLVCTVTGYFEPS